MPDDQPGGQQVSGLNTPMMVSVPRPGHGRTPRSSAVSMPAPLRAAAIQPAKVPRSPGLSPPNALAATGNSGWACPKLHFDPIT